MITIYHNSRCSKSRETLKILEESGVQPRIVNYLDTPPSVSELDELLNQLGLQPEQIARTHEDVFEEMGLDRTPPRSRQEWLEVLTKAPILIERPIVSDGRRAVIGRPPEKVRELLK